MSPMLAPSEKLPAWPKWLPMDVQIEAERIVASGLADDALVFRLATDKRMKTVWPVLEKYKKEKPCQLSEWATLMRDRADVPPPDSSDPLALFFWCAYTIAWMQAGVSTVSRYNLPIAQYRLEAARLRLSAAKLRGLHARHGRQLSDQDTFIEIHISNIEDAAKFCDEIIEAYTKLKDVEAPLVVDRDFGSREARGYVRMLAAEMRNLFGQLLGGTLAKVASVALTKEITAAQVHNWARPAPL